MASADCPAESSAVSDRRSSQRRVSCVNGPPPIALVARASARLRLTDSICMTGIFVASALVVALVLIALVVHRRARRPGATVPEAHGTSLVTTTGNTSADAGGPGPNDLVLVPLPNDTGQALVVSSEDVLTIFDRSGLTKRDTSAGSG